MGVLFHAKGTWGQHVDLAVRKTRNVSFPIRRLIFSLSELPVNILIKIYNLKIRPVLTYGCELWGVGLDKSIVRRVDANFCKLVLGLGRQAVNSASIIELKGIESCSFIEQQAVKYFLKLASSSRGLQRKCFEFQMRLNSEGWWGSQMLAFIRELGMESWVGEPMSATAKKELRKIIDQRNWNELFEDALSKKSLQFFSRLNHEENEYLNQLSRDARRVITYFRLGMFIWQAPKRVDGTRVCVLCGESENAEHLLVDCRGLSNMRQSLPQHFQQLLGVEIMNLKDKSDNLALATFLSAAFKERKTRLF